MGLLLTEQASYPVTAGRAGQFLPAENTVASQKQASKQSPTMGSMALAGTASAMGCWYSHCFLDLSSESGARQKLGPLC